MNNNGIDLFPVTSLLCGNTVYMHDNFTPLRLNLNGFHSESKAEMCLITVMLQEQHTNRSFILGE